MSGHHYCISVSSVTDMCTCSAVLCWIRHPSRIWIRKRIHLLQRLSLLWTTSSLTYLGYGVEVVANSRVHHRLHTKTLVFCTNLVPICHAIKVSGLSGRLATSLASRIPYLGSIVQTEYLCRKCTLLETSINSPSDGLVWDPKRPETSCCPDGRERQCRSGGRAAKAVIIGKSPKRNINQATQPENGFIV